MIRFMVLLDMKYLGEAWKTFTEENKSIGRQEEFSAIYIVVQKVLLKN